jgi:Phage portal protein, SPP1 Gp6-like
MTLDPLMTRHRTLQVQPVAKNPYTPGSSPWWLFRLSARLDGQHRALKLLDDYYRGRQDTFRLASTAAIDSGIAQLFRGINANLAKLICDAPRHRLEVFGFRTGDEATDDLLWRVWQANDMDAESDLAHKDALAMRACPVLIEPVEGGLPRITPQNPLNVVVETAAADRRMVRAALKRWQDDDGRLLYTLYLPDRIEFWQDTKPGFASTIRTALGLTELAYEPRSLERDQPSSIPNPLGEVPFAVIPNMGRSDGTYEAEHEAVLPLLDLYNKTLLDMATTSEFSAFPQRWAIGVDFDEGEEPVTDEAADAALGGKAIARVRAAVDAMITANSPSAQFGQFQAADLGNYVKALDQIRANVGTITFTPYHLLLNMPTSVPATGEALKSAEVGLTAKVRDHHREKGVGWERSQRLVLRMLEQPVPPVIETIWRDPETRSEAQHVDALGKMRLMLGLPLKATWELLPASPTQIRRWQQQLKDEPPAPAPVAPTTPSELVLP